MPPVHRRRSDTVSLPDTVILQAKRQFHLNHLITVLWYAVERGLVSLAVSCWGLRGACRRSGGRACKSEGRSGRAEGSALRSGAKTRARKGPRSCAVHALSRPAPSAGGAASRLPAAPDSARPGTIAQLPPASATSPLDRCCCTSSETSGVVHDGANCQALLSALTHNARSSFHAPNRRRAWRRWDAGRRTAVRQRKALVFESS